MNAAVLLPDEALEWWADRFTNSTLRDCMTFEQFLALPHALRERRLAQQSNIDAAQFKVERLLPAQSIAHNRTLIAPVCVSRRAPRKPWFFRVR